MLPSPDLGPRASLLPFLDDHHLPYVVPAVFYWVISFVFHYIDTRGLLSKYKLHTSAEDLTKNRASRKDVVKFALIQQVAQCSLGYLMADDTEQFVSPEYAIALWVQRLRYVGMMIARWLPYTSHAWSWPVYALKGSGSTPQPAPWQDALGDLIGNSTQASSASELGLAPFTPQELILAKAMYWILVPLFQYISAMALADTFQYFTHRAFHVNKWLYTFWDWVMGTGWSPHDSRAQAKYQKGKATAEAVAAKAKLRTLEPQPAVGRSTAVS
ncbi:MAG: hypothetical protein Q9213_003237 [Squamulea squamosa]